MPMDQFLVLLFIVCVALLQVLSRALQARRASATQQTAEEQAAQPERAWTTAAELDARVPSRRPPSPPQRYETIPAAAISGSAPRHRDRLRLARGEKSTTLRAGLGDKTSLKRAIALMTILGPPRANDPP